ncbi:MFS transporter [Nitrospirillum amazonense]|uniref:Putative MFS family arabinose efflux permease n=2 Tax=Nitrospirillum amazonense TaxID=28077 RepID=A0A560G783_9PROT|nr:MFS transporter [Nitrospirillum amazonense]MEC4592160.1 MFS transporter [Nitrospirillum amazonense]TWB29681.1 putative MFS family arabinose efflux permease [Nitrospirillum amazonense]
MNSAFINRKAVGSCAGKVRTALQSGWYMVILLTAAQVVSYIDRFLPSLLIAPIKTDLGLSDFQVGLLLGPAFGVFYVLMGLPMGWMADRFSRRGILAAGITIWCCMTAAASLARGFPALFAARLGVGLGEAAIAPCAVSLVSDRFPRQRRARALSVFMSGTFLGAGIAFLLGGPLVHAIAGLPVMTVPLLGELRAWQLSFLIVGLPGLVLALLMFTFAEPERQDRAVDADSGLQGGQASIAQALRFILKRWRTFGVLFVGSAACVTMGSLAFWNATLFQRSFGWNVRDMGIATGILFLTGGPLGTGLGIWLTNRWIRLGRKDATLRALLVGLLIAVPGFAAYPMMPSAPLAIAALFFAFVGQAMAAAAGPASLTLIAPGQIKSQATAVYYLVISISGQLIGPPPVGWMTDLFGDPARLGWAMSIEALVIGVTALTVLSLGMPAYRAGVVAVEKMIAKGD